VPQAGRFLDGLIPIMAFVMNESRLTSEALPTLVDLCLDARSGDPDDVRWNWFIYARGARQRLALLELGAS